MESEHGEHGVDQDCRAERAEIESHGYPPISATSLLA
jgi:hypothetical protein